MNFDNRNAVKFQRVVDGHRCMSISGGIDDDGAHLPEGFLYPGDKLAFIIGLFEIKHKAVRVGGDAASVTDIIQRLIAINFRLALAEHVQVRTVQDQNSVVHGVALFAG